MSRTYKDKPYKLKETNNWRQDMEPVFRDYGGFIYQYSYIYSKTTKTKKRKEVDTEDHWMTTPSWWNRLTYTRPERRKVKMLLATIADVETLDVPDTGRLPKIYFW